MPFQLVTPDAPCATQTTYDVIIRDTGVLRRFDWSAVVIDEGHSLKGGLLRALASTPALS